MNWREQGEEHSDHLEGYYGNLDKKKCSWTELGSWNRKEGVQRVVEKQSVPTGCE